MSRRVLITAGPTREPIDAVRVITNNSTGEMGYAVAEAALKRKYKVSLISGSVHIPAPKGVKFIGVTTALEMKKEVLKEAKRADCLIMAAAVADFRVKRTIAGKIKKKKTLKLELVENQDILKSVPRGRLKYKIGFALESSALVKNALRKLFEKDLDMIVANAVTKKYSPFGPGRKDFVLIFRSGEKIALKNVTKKEAAEAVLDSAAKYL